MSYAVKEIFLTLQGEGMQAGRRAVFLRFAGCNLWSGYARTRAHGVYVAAGMTDGGKFFTKELR